MKPGKKSEYPTNIDTLGALIRQKRMDLGMSLLEVSRQVNTANGKMAESYLSRIEENQKAPSYEVAAQLAKVLNLDFTAMQQLIVIKKMGKFYTPSSQNDKIKVLQTIQIVPPEKAKGRKGMIIIENIHPNKKD